MLQPKHNTQNETTDEQVSLFSYKRIDDLESKLQKIISQETNHTNRQELRGMMFSLKQKFSTAFPDNPTNQPSPSVTATTVESTPLLILEVNFKPSEFFTGDPDHCGEFMLQCQLALRRASQLFTSDSAKTTYLISQLKDDAIHWAQSYMSSHDIGFLSFNIFLEEFT